MVSKYPISIIFYTHKTGKLMKYYALLLSTIITPASFAMEMVPQRGILIAIEGIDGSGKSTFAHHLEDALHATYAKVKLTKEPGDTEVGKQIHEIVQTSTIPPLDAKTEFLLFAADRAEHFSKVIQPLLKANYIIISDRLSDSSLAYQGYGKGLDKKMIKSTNTWAMSGIKPDLTIFIKIPVKIALERIKKRNETVTAFEKEPFLEKVADGFEKIYTSEGYCNLKTYKNIMNLCEYAEQTRNKTFLKTGVNLAVTDPEFATIPANHIKLITVDGTTSEEEIIATVIPGIQQWLTKIIAQQTLKKDL
jgi:dTMP kinase